ncbi:MAG: enolase C-terminal domain-like protein [Opitutaceae bacterium]
MINRRRFLTAGLGAIGAAASGPLLRASPDDGPSLQTSQEKGDVRNLRITDLKTFLVDAGNDENYVYVKIFTNQGITGLGEGTLSGKCATVASAIQEHKRYLVGKDPGEIERLWQSMFRGPRYRGGPVLMSALSAVEIALWDILGQAVGLPIWRMLGGKARDRVRLYCHEGYLERISHRKKRRPQGKDEALQLWAQKKEDGWTCVKGGFFPVDSQAVDFRKAIREGIEHLAEVREVVGPDFDIIVEVHGKANPLAAIEFCNRAEPYRPLWVEEVTQLENEVIAEVRQVRQQTRVPLATGERLCSRYDFGPLCSERLVDVIMPDVVHVGGILEMKKIAALAEVFRVDVSPHNPQSEVSTLASMHVCMSTPNATLLEIGSGQDPFWQDLFYGGYFSYERGYAPPPERPGLGIDLDESVAARFPYDEKDFGILHFPDGSVTDR